MNDVFTVPLAESGKAASIYAIVMSSETMAALYRKTTDQFETYSSTAWASYALSLFEVGATGVYQFELPASLKVAGKSYAVLVFEKPTAGGSPVPSDELIQAGGMTYGLIPPTTGRVQVISD